MSTSALRIFAGLALAMGGAILVLLALDLHGIAARNDAAAAVSAKPCPEVRCPKCPAEKPCPTAPAAVTPAPAASSSAPAAASSSAAPASGNGFRFTKGAITFEKAEVPRLIALANELKKTQRKVVLEGYGDEPGTDDKTLGLGRRRATLARQLLAEIGFDGERLVVTARDLAEAPDRAGTVVVRQEEPR